MKQRFGELVGTTLIASILICTSVSSLLSCQKKNPKSDHQSRSEKRADTDTFNIPLTFSPEIVKFEGFLGYGEPVIVEPQTFDQSALEGVIITESRVENLEIGTPEKSEVQK
jgi:hypothetical protein